MAWLVLLAVFIGISGWGWLEYRKVEVYRRWAQQFDHAKYDIYAVLGQKGSTLTWGPPTRHGPIDLITVSLEEVAAIRLRVDQQIVDWHSPPTKGHVIVIELAGHVPQQSWSIPFTEISLAVDWTQHLHQVLPLH